MFKGKSHSLLCLLICCSFGMCGHARNEYVLENDQWSLTANLQTLQMRVRLHDNSVIELSQAQTGLGRVSSVRRLEKRLLWDLADRALSIDLSLDGNELAFEVTAKGTSSFTWPVTRTNSPIKALILPRAEGIYVPLDNPRWTDYLAAQDPWNTLEQLSMPFWGLDCNGTCLTWIVTNPYNNTLTFKQRDNSLHMAFRHAFTRFNRATTFGFRIVLSKTASRVEPARQFRRYLTEHQQFVSLQQKARLIPRVNRLQGAAHVYLWGDGLFSRHNIPRARWKPFCQTLIKQASAEGPTPGKRIKQLLTTEQWQAIENLVREQWPNNHQKGVIAAAISDILGRRDFFREGYFEAGSLNQAQHQITQAWCADAPIAEVCRMNCCLFNQSFEGFFTPTDTWGDGVSLALLKRFQEADLDRLRLCVAGWEGVEKRPEVAKRADRLGFLFGTYDSFHSIHDPALIGTDRTWSTAQFGQALYDTGRILKSDGTSRGGFKGVGAKLSPIAARPYVEQRVRRNLRNVPYSYYFIDCDAFGEYYDDYTPARPIGQADDVRARIDRLQWISKTFQVPVGSEGGCHLFAPAIHVSEGIFGPGFGWGDPDHKDRRSPYYLGGYWPPEGPAVFVKQVPMKEKYQFFHYDPRFRLPLYEIVYHDSVITTHIWGNGSLKFNNMLDTVALTELLYLVPPLYHLNLDEFDKHKERIVRHYGVFSPLHRQFGFAQMTDFRWLTKDRLVQCTEFNNRLEIVANFSRAPYTYRSQAIPGRSVLTYNEDTGETKIFTP